MIWSNPGKLRPEWVDIGNDEWSAVYGIEDGGNYKSLKVRRHGPGHWRFSINEFDRGYRATLADAKIAAIGYAACSVSRPLHSGDAK